MKSTTYAGRRLRPGDSFEARGESDARVLSAIGAAQRVQAAPAAPAYSTRALTAAPAAHAEPAFKPPAASAEQVQPEFVIQVEGEPVVLDGMEVEALHALADRLNVKVHHRAGAAYVRKALVSAQ